MMDDADEICTRSELFILQQINQKRIKKDSDVTELYLAQRDLVEMCDLSPFKNLKYLWVNDNDLKIVDFLDRNYCLSELHLENNHLTSITGRMSHLTNVNTLMLHGNQLMNLDSVVKELKSMATLKNLSLFYNPVAHEPDYRLFIIYNIPSLELLDRKEITKKERDKARRLYEEERERIAGTVAFGRRCTTPNTTSYITRSTHHSANPSREVANNFYGKPYDDPEQAVAVRANQRGLVEYSRFDWGKVVPAHERHIAKTTRSNPQIITLQFK